MKTNLKKYFMEFIGTYFLVLTVGCVVMMGTIGVIPAIAVGAVLMLLVYAGGYISGGHYNPAVTLAALIRKALPWSHSIQYWVAQFVGAICASMTVMFFAKDILPLAPIELDIVPMFIGEMLFTFLLAFVVLHTATTAETEKNSYFGLAIGSCVMVGIFTVGGICAAAFNPAVAVGVGLLGLVTWKMALLTIIANFVGGILAAGAFFLTHVCAD